MIFKRLVLPAPEAPMINVAYPGDAKPDTLLRIVCLLVIPIAGSFSLSKSVVLTSTSKKRFVKESFIGLLHSFFACSTKAIGSISGLVASDYVLKVLACCYCA